jgi:membrane protein required for colicin V production
MRVTDFNAFDWLLIGILLVSTALAFRRGLVRAIFGLAGLFVGFKLAGWSYIHLGDWIVYLKLMESSASARIVAFLVVLAVGAVLCELAGQRVQRTARAVGLGLLDHMLGLAFGFVRGCVVGIALLMITVNFSPQAQVVTTSVLSPYLFAAAHDVSFLVPQYIQQLMANGPTTLKAAPPSWINRH